MMIPIFKSFILLILITLSSLCPAQLPNTKIFMFDLLEKNGKYSLSGPRLLSEPTHSGYENQPKFITQSQILIASDIRKPKEPNLWLLDIEKQKRIGLSNTSIKQYSPSIRPGTGKLTYVGVHHSGQQYLFETDMFGHQTVINLIPELQNIGYYAWKDTSQLCLFLVDTPNILVIHHLTTGKTEPIAYHPGRCMMWRNDGQLIFVQKADSLAWYLKQYDPASKLSRIITRTPVGSEDFTILPDGTILMTEGSRVMQFHPEKSPIWQLLADLEPFHLQHLGRIVHFNGTLLTIVNTTP